MKTEYRVVVGRSIDRLEQIVNQLLTEGWTLVGGVSITQYQQDDKSRTTTINNVLLCVQAMTRETKTTED